MRAISKYERASHAYAGRMPALPALREYPAHAGRFSYAVDRQDVSAGAHVSAVALRCLVHLVKRVAHRVFQRLVDSLLSPEKRILILHPLVIPDRPPPGVRQHSSNQHHSLTF